MGKLGSCPGNRALGGGGRAFTNLLLLDCETMLISAQATASRRDDLFFVFCSSLEFGRKIGHLRT